MYYPIIPQIRNIIFKGSLFSSRSLDIRWLLLFEDTTSNYHEVVATEDFVFNIGVSIRWNEVDIPPLSHMVAVKLYALTPLFFNEKLKPEKNRYVSFSPP